jgi:hypothetical protein
VATRHKGIFIMIRAIRKKLERERFLKILDETKGAWTDKNHPELETEKDVDQYVRGKRESYRNRLRSLLRGNNGFSR